jgi:hypothetical protein
MSWFRLSELLTRCFMSNAFGFDELLVDLRVVLEKDLHHLAQRLVVGHALREGTARGVPYPYRNYAGARSNARSTNHQLASTATATDPACSTPIR